MDVAAQVSEAVEAVPMIWDLMFEQTPIVIRWFLGAMLVAIMSLVGLVYKRLRADIKRLHARIDGVETRMDNDFREFNTSLLMVARNGMPYQRDNRW